MSQLALSLRPQNLDEVVGAEHVKKAVRHYAQTQNWPNVFLFHGPPGTGKTTLALIVARLAGADESSIHEVNASADNGVDAARALGETSMSCPFTGQHRVIILNEAHRLTAPSMDCLKDYMEKGSTIWILTTDEPGKISSAILSRAKAATFELKPLSTPDMGFLVHSALSGKVSSQEAVEVSKFLHEKSVYAPREILGVLDQYLAGVPLENCVHGSAHEPLYADIAKAVLAGSWSRLSNLLGQVKAVDFRAMVAVVSAFMGSSLLKEPMGPKADALATCLVNLGSSNFADGVANQSCRALLYKCCKALGGK